MIPAGPGMRRAPPVFSGQDTSAPQRERGQVSRNDKRMPIARASGEPAPRPLSSFAGHARARKRTICCCWACFSQRFPEPGGSPGCGLGHSGEEQDSLAIEFPHSARTNKTLDGRRSSFGPLLPTSRPKDMLRPTSPHVPAEGHASAHFSPRPG